MANTIENDNTFIGRSANGKGGITNATAIGANASVTQSNSLVLGNGVNVGIGTTEPQAQLHVQGGYLRRRRRPGNHSQVAERIGLSPAND